MSCKYIDIDIDIPDNSYCSEDYSNNIPVINTNIEYSHFYKNYIEHNRACIIKQGADNWPCYTQWRTGERGQLNLEYMIATYRDLPVPVVSERGERTECTLGEYLSRHWNTRNGESGDLKYLKDWHLRRARPKPEQSFYVVPEYFASDWLNEYALDNDRDDFMFVYIGPRDTWTPFHRDVYASFSWSANIVGRKRWILLFPGEEDKIPQKEDRVDVRKYLHDSVKCYDFIQESGDIVFVPSGWHHQVHNVEDAVSVNHNWVNAANIMTVWRALDTDFELVKKEIREYKEESGWAEHCQLVLKTLFGIDHAAFLEFVKHICRKRLKAAVTDTPLTHFHAYALGRNHILRDLRSLSELLQDMKDCEAYSGDSAFREIRQLINEIDSVIKSK